MTKKAKKALEDRVAVAYNHSCHGIQIPIMKVSQVMAIGIESAMAGDDDETLKKKIRAFVETIRAN